MDIDADTRTNRLENEKLTIIILDYVKLHQYTKNN